MNFKHIHIGQIIEKAVTESGIELSRICNFLKCTEEDIKEMYESESLDTEILLKWSKLLEYDFFRLYTQHLVLYAPPSAADKNTKGLLCSARNDNKTTLPQFRKNIYTKDVINFVLEQIKSGEMTRNEVIERYKIPKTTLYKWISKYEK